MPVSVPVSMPGPVTIRAAEREDMATIAAFIRALARYERAEAQVEATPETLAETLTGPHRAAAALIAEEAGRPVGFAVYFFTYSTWQARRGLYLEDLYVVPQARGTGVGKALMRRLAAIALDNECGRFEWSVLDWNQPAIDVYEALGALPQREWIRYRLDGERLAALAGAEPVGD